MKKIAGLRWLGIALLFLGALGTSMGLANVFQIATWEFGSSSDFWRHVLLEDSGRWLWQIGILVVVAGVWMVNQSFSMQLTEHKAWFGIGLILFGAVSTAAGLFPTILYFEKGAQIFGSSSEHWKYILLNKPERWVWQIGILIVVAGIWMVNRSLKRVQWSDHKTWLGMVLLILGSISTTLGLITALFIYPHMATISTKYWSYVLLEAPDRWLWQIGILVMISAFWMVNQSFKKVQWTERKTVS